MKIAFAASESTPFAKTGGLADVVGALPAELAKLGHEVSLFLPIYTRVRKFIAAEPKYAVSQVVGFIEGKSAIHLARSYGDRKQNYAGQNFWARGYFVSTVGRDEATIRGYIRTQ